MVWPAEYDGISELIFANCFSMFISHHSKRNCQLFILNWPYNKKTSTVHLSRIWQKIKVCSANVTYTHFKDIDSKIWPCQSFLTQFPYWMNKAEGYTYRTGGMFWAKSITQIHGLMEEKGKKSGTCATISLPWAFNSLNPSFILVSDGLSVEFHVYWIILIITFIRLQ